MDARSLHMLHNPRDQNIFAIAHRVYFDFLAHHVLIHQNGVFLLYSVDDGHIFLYVVIVIGNFHALAAQHIGGPHQHRISQLISRLLCLFHCEDGFARWALYVQPLQQLIEFLSVFGRVDIVQLGSIDLISRVVDGLCQFDGGLSTKLHHDPFWLFLL